MNRMQRLRWLPAFALAAAAACGSEALADEASSPNFSLESSTVGGGGGTGMSPNFEAVGVVGQVVESGSAGSPNFSASGGLLNDFDLDADNIAGGQDLCPVESAACWDLDLDGCIDVPDLDTDTDGVTRGSCDCDDGNIQAWGTPGETQALIWVMDPVSGSTFLSWSEPASLGGNANVYDTIRSGDPADFQTGTTCVESDDGGDREAFDFADPLAGNVFYYVVRTENLCPLGDGTLGFSSLRRQRAGRTCP